MNAIVNTQAQSAVVYLPKATETLIKDVIAENTRKAYQRALAKLEEWLSGQTLSDTLLATYITELH